MLDSAQWAISSVVERFLHTEEATGSIPVSPTMCSLPLPHFLSSKAAIFIGISNLREFWTEREMSATLRLSFYKTESVVWMWTKLSEVIP